MAEPKLPKLPKSKIKPAIQPGKIVGSSAMKTQSGRKISRLASNISTKNTFSNLQRQDPKIRNVPGIRTVTNLMSTFGTPRTEKIIRKELQLLRNTLVETFEIAKLLRTSLSTIGDNKTSGTGKKGGGALLGITLALAATWNKITGFVGGAWQGLKNIGSDAIEGLKNIGDSISEFASEGWEKISDSVSEGLTGLKGWFDEWTSKLPTLKETGDAIGSAITAIFGFFQLLNPIKLGEKLASKWFGGKKDEIATVNESDDTSGDTGDDTEGDNQEENKDNSLIASTNLSGLGNVKSPLEGLTAGGFKGKTGDNKDDGKKLNLSDEDYKMLAYAISGEAGPGKDKAAVAASILNRVSSKNFPNTVKDVVLDKDQYEAITKGLAFHDEDLVNFLKSDEGQKQIIEALGILQGRTDFKGQSQLKNRVVGEDPMLDPLGNFYHYFWQGDPNRSKPKDWQAPDINQFLKDVDIKGVPKDVSSIKDMFGSAEIIPLVIGGNDGKVASAPKKKGAMTGGTTGGTSSGMKYLSSGNPDSHNLAYRAITGIMVG